MTPEMQPLVDFLRRYGQARTDEEFNGVIFWSDDQLEEVLLMRGEYAAYRLRPTLDPTIFRIDAPAYFFLRLDYRVITDSGSWLEVVSSVNTLERTITFEVAPGEQAYGVSGFFVSMWAALADFWDRKAQQRHNYVDFKAGHNDMRMSQEYQHCITQRDYYNRKTLHSHRRSFKP
jgi:hypothetical protein